MSKIEFEIDSDMDKTPIFKQTIDLKRFMDEKLINEQAVDLNVK